MNIEWMAHSCFKVTLENGKVIVFDPYDESVGYRAAMITADIAVVSHSHKNHACLKNIVGNYTLVHEAKEYDINGVKITGYTLPGEDEKLTTTNKIYKVEAEGVTLLHMGDIDKVPSEEFLKSLGDIDVLFIPVGGRFTINGEQAAEICKAMEPNIIIPMHYKTLFLGLDLDTVYPFTDAAGRYFDRSHLVKTSFDITASNLKKRSRIIVMEASMDQ